MTKPTIGIAGAGLIGASWATGFAAYGFPVRVWDPAPETGAYLADFVDAAIRDVPGGLSPSEQGEITCLPSQAEMVAGCALILENGPEREEVKRTLLRELDSAAPPETIIASSTSSLLLSKIAADCLDKDRVIIAHPFNPPHMLPLVELFGLDAPTVARAAEIFRMAGKHPVTMKKEMIGHVANRLTSALFREALYILEQGVASAEDIDACISEGPGLRWALMGPFMNYHLGGGDGGIAYYMKHLGPSQVKRWADHGTPQMTEDFIQQVIEEVETATHGETIDTMSTRRDQMLQKILEIKSKKV